MGKQVVHFSNDFECAMVQRAPSPKNVAKLQHVAAEDNQMRSITKVGFCGFGRNRDANIATQAPRATDSVGIVKKVHSVSSQDQTDCQASRSSAPTKSSMLCILW